MVFLFAGEMLTSPLSRRLARTPPLVGPEADVLFFASFVTSLGPLARDFAVTGQDHNVDSVGTCENSPKDLN